MHSALKKDGKALYEYARAGETVERAPRHVSIHALDLQEVPAPDGQRWLKIRAHCSKGTYIRTLGEDIGQALGCGAHLVALRRVVTGPFVEADCIRLEDLEHMPEADRARQLRPVECLLPTHTPVQLLPEDAGRFLSGVRRRGHWPDAEHVAVFGTHPKALLGTAHIKAGELIPERLLSPPEIHSILESLA
jgi:tRNA pseudouridine55 synthase